MLKGRISNYLNQLLKELGETQEGLAKRLGITQSSLQGYLKENNLPSIDVLLKMAELGGITLDELVKSESVKIIVNKSHDFAVAGRDLYISPRITRKTEYKPGPEDITGDQANRLKDLVNKVVEKEKEVKKKPKTHGAIWNALNRRMGVTYYREIKTSGFDMAELYLSQWIGRLKRSQKRTNAEQWRKETQSSIFARARNQLGWTKDDLDSYILERYNKSSIRDLTKRELQQLYNIIFSKKGG